MVITPEKQNDAEYQALLKTFAGQISSEVFNNASTEIHICDVSLKTLKVVPK